jgi:hypothetical protein
MITLAMNLISEKEKFRLPPLCGKPAIPVAKRVLARKPEPLKEVRENAPLLAFI